MLGGHLADRKGAGYVIRRVLTGMTFVFAAVSIVATWVAPPLSTVLLLALIATWGVVGWSFPPAQQSYLVHLAPTLTPVVLSLNSSAMYLGASMGALASSTVVALGHVSAVGWVASACELIGLALVLINGYKGVAHAAPAAATKAAAAPVR
jgi:predicted MFS family arabinose efflux permease